jgi:hypothetical protein
MARLNSILPLLCLALSAEAQDIFPGPIMRTIGSAYTANTAVFDGSDDYMTIISSGPTGLANGKQVTFSTWVKFSADNSFEAIAVFASSVGATRFAVFRNNSNQFYIYGQSAVPADVLYLVGTTSVTISSGWVHLYICVDLADTAKRKMYINGVAETLTVNTYSDVALGLVGASFKYRIGADGVVANLLSGAVTELWFDDSYLDDTTKFASGGKPISLGSDGSLPTGSSPVFYLKGSGDGFNVNSGTGGDFTLTGSLGTTTPP